MTVKQLIEQLSKFDSETQVIGMCTDPSDYVYKVPIESIYLGSPYDSEGIHCVTNEEIDWDDDSDPYDEDGEYIGEDKVLIINLGDV